MGPSQDYRVPDPQNFIQAAQALVQDMIVFFARTLQEPGTSSGSFPLPAAEELAGLQSKWAEQHLRLWNSLQLLKKDDVLPPVAEADPGDHRFSSPEWRNNPAFDYIRQAYLLNSSFIYAVAELMPTTDKKAKGRLRFLARQFVDALSPANFAATNPEVIRRAFETNGQSFTDGINNLIGDMGKGRISTSDDAAFEIGKNLATTPGAVVFENELIQLIQYAPSTASVAKRPLLIVPPCINKFYILDLEPENSFVRYAIEQGNTVFLVSWRNPGAEHGHLTWSDYLEYGAIAAIDKACEICRIGQLNALGWCVGGTLLSCAQAVLVARGGDKLASLTLLTTLLDYSSSGDLGLFVDENSVAARESAIAKGGVMKGSELANVFSLLRANDLVWNYVVNSYLKGYKPKAFALLFWNADSTNLPGPFVCWYLRNLYLENRLCVPGKLEMCGEKINLHDVDAPSYVLATRDDHIVPWQSCYGGARLLGGASRFVLGAGGHVAGVINPAHRNKRSYWLNTARPSDAREWLAGAQEHQGSWWSDWSDWLRQHAGGERRAPAKPGNARNRVIEPAPGRYVKVKGL